MGGFYGTDEGVADPVFYSIDLFTVHSVTNNDVNGVTDNIS